MVITIISILLAILLIYLLVKFIKDKNYKALIIMIVIIIVIGLIYFIYTNSRIYQIVYSGYISDFDTMVISNINDYNEFMVDSNEWNKEYKRKISSAKYNEKYFENKSLALVFISTGSSSNTFNGVDISTNSNTLIVKPNIDYSKGTVTLDITGKLILIEINKNITNIEILR